MAYQGDIRLGDTIDFQFTTVSTTGAPTTLAGSPVVSAYIGNSTTQLTAGITLSVDFDGVAGLHNIRVVATSGNGYATATNVGCVVTTGTVGGTSIAGYVAGSFSIENRSGLMPTTAARTLDVTATGGAGIDWANVEAPTTTLALTGTTIATTQKVDVETIKTNPVVNGGTITFPTTATLASTTNITAGTVTTATNVTTVNGLAANVITATSIAADAITAAKIATNAIDADAIAADAVTEIQAGLATPTNITAGIITTVTNLTNAPTAGDFTATMKTSIGTAVAASAVASVTGNVGGNVNGNVVGSVGSVVGLTASNLDATVSSRATPAQVGTAVTTVVQTTIPDTVPADGTAPSMQSALYMITQFLTERAVASTTVTVAKPDGTTALMTFTLNDAVTPTSITRAT